MSLRFYFESSNIPALSPAFATIWERTTDADWMLMTLVKSGSAMTTKVIPDVDPVNPSQTLVRQYQYVMPAGIVFTALDPVNAQIRVQEFSTVDNYFLHLRICIFDILGTTEQIVLKNGTSGLTEFATSLTNRTFANTLGAAANWTSSSGELLLVEVGLHKTSTATTDNAEFRFGSANGTDLPVDETTTADNVPWIEFPNSSLPASVGASVFERGILDGRVLR